MPLSNEQVQKIVKERRNGKELQDGVKHQERLRFHTETILKKDDLSSYYRDFLAWLGAPAEGEPELLAEDKFKRLVSLIRTPVQTVELLESIYSRLFKVFFSQDSYFNYRFTDDSLEDDWNEFRDAKFWPTIGFQAMQTAIDSVWVVDLPGEQLTEFPEPTDRLIDIKDVIDIKNDEENNCIYVIFRFGDMVFVYDDESFRVFNSDGDEVKELLVEAPHDLGYTPARMMWSEKLKAQNFINKEAPVSKELGDLDWLLWHLTMKRYLDLGSGFPTTASYEIDDDYQDGDITENKQRKTNKRPKGNHLMGPGSYMTVPAPREGEQDMMKNPIQVINPDVDVLDWHVKEEVRLKDTIFKSVVGTDTEVRNAAAKNEKQIDAAFESQESVLFRVKKNFEIIHKFADSTKARLRYGERFLDCDIDYGTNFFLKDINDLQEELQTAKDSGAPDAIIESINDNILHTKYRDDDKSITRANIINDLDPMPNRTQVEARDLFKDGGIDKINFIIKSNLISFVRRFERENTDLVNFGSLTNYNRKIEQINAELVKFAEEMNNVEPNIKENEVITETPGDI